MIDISVINHIIHNFVAVAGADERRDDTAGIPPYIDVVIDVTIVIYIIRTNINDVRRVNLNILDSLYYLGYIFGAGTET